MSTADTPAAEPAGLAEPRRQLKVGRREIILGLWLIASAVLAVLAQNPAGVLHHFPRRSFVWFDFAAMGLSAYAAGLCLTRWRNPPTLWMAVAFIGFTAFVTDSVAALSTDRQFAYTFSLAIWWIAPATVAAWTEAALAIARATPLANRQPWQRLLQAGRPFAAHPFREFLGAVGVPATEPWRLPWLSVGIWSAAAVVAAAGSVPNVFFGTAHQTGVAWRGIASPILSPYLAFVAFTVIVLALALIVLLLAYAQVDRPRIKQDDLARLQWAPWAAAAILVLVCGAEALVSLRAGSESLDTLALGLSALLFALVALDAASYSNADILYSGPRRRLIAGVLWIGFALYMVTIPIHDMQRAGMVAFLVIILPLLPSAARAIEGVPRRAERPISSQAERLRALLSGDGRKPPAHRMPSLRIVEETLAALGAADGAEVQVASSDLQALVDGYKGGEEDADIRADLRLSRFLATFPPLQSDGDWDDRHKTLMHLVHETARTLDESDQAHNYQRHPTGEALVRVVCLKKAGAVASRTRQQEQFDREKRLVLAYDVWALGDRSRTERLTFGQAITKTVEELENEKNRRLKRQNSDDLLLPPPDHTALNAYNQRYPAAFDRVFRRWVVLLEKQRRHHRDAGADWNKETTS